MTHSVRAQPAPSAEVVVSGLGHHYGDRRVFTDVTFTLTTGVTGLVGVNGAGKSTLLHVLATVLRPDTGEASVAGLDHRRQRLAVRRQVTLAPQIFVPPRAMRVGDFLTYMAWMRGLRRSVRASEVSRVLGVVELEDRRQDVFATLSGGMVQRVNIAQALLGSPTLILLDEPMDGLDPEQRVRIRQLIGRLGAHSCVLLSSHVMDDIVPIADRVLMLDAGSIAFDGTPASLGELGEQSVVAGSGISPHEAAFLAIRTRGGHS